ncbi:MAG: PIG-L family deacetylase [Bacteroidetes bacterium]|nr:PIG-L family deacetylase [Bacteroidota bacterium]
MRKIGLLLSICMLVVTSMSAQKTSADIYAQIKKMGVVGSVLYVAAHPDDENNSFLPYLTKERMYRTAYLSLTRGDGGQNLIGKEQGVELGFIRTQELLAARAQDGAEQYFSRAYEFGFSKSSEEALSIWDHQQVLSDAVWVIRKFQPDIIITRFPRDARAGHGHHSASAIIANEAYIAAADSTKFPEQFAYGVKPWKAKRILWNTFNFGTVNTTNDTQLKLEVGGYNAVLGKSYGEIGAEARTMHKSQGEGRPRRRGASYEFFETTGGDIPTSDIMDGIETNWDRFQAPAIQLAINDILKNYTITAPSKSVPALVNLYKSIAQLPMSLWRGYKLAELQSIIKEAAGLYIEASTQQQEVFPGSSLQVQLFLNQRTNTNTVLEKLILPGRDSSLNKQLVNNQNSSWDYTFKVPVTQAISQPYWLVQPKTEGMFVVNDQTLIGKAENDPVFTAACKVIIEGQPFTFIVPVNYKYVDPTKGDVFQPVVVVPVQEIKYDKEVVVINGEKQVSVGYQEINHTGTSVHHQIDIKSALEILPTPKEQVFKRTIQYDHIPTITYFAPATTKLVNVNLKTKGSKVGYIDGAGDKLPEALIELGYQVTVLKETDIELSKLKTYDAIVVGIRAYNMFDYLTTKNDILNEYIAQGGNLVVQYLKSNQVGINKVKVGPYAFTVNAGKRVTQENAPVDFVLPNHSVLNFPNKMDKTDFDNWVQERSTYMAENVDTHFEAPLSMSDKGETASTGSLLIAPYGKGNMAYVSLVLFRQLPAGNPGAYKLLANIVSLPKH